MVIFLAFPYGYRAVGRGCDVPRRSWVSLFPLASLGQGPGSCWTRRKSAPLLRRRTRTPGWGQPVPRALLREAPSTTRSSMAGRPFFSWRWRALVNSERCGRVYDPSTIAIIIITLFPRSFNNKNNALDRGCSTTDTSPREVSGMRELGVCMCCGTPHNERAAAALQCTAHRH